ncbi:hypothetical protein QDY63_14580 [Pseudomonas brenneri]|uniref:hypothetical protein n=1 Tax=Pseudomonas brenneri TaxID=129817 RepID=UPI0025A1EB92|nr:hypothetical protein [Pseudomonas brenneri]WJM94039.1 hypothetical protein QDY63_14580 [Pseudomonas brenneri]
MLSLSIAGMLLYLVGGIYTFILLVRMEKKTGPISQGLVVLGLFMAMIWPISWVCALLVWLVEQLTEVCNRP